MTRASIVIVLYNGAAYLENLLGSLLEQLTPEDELILVDNASQDGSNDLVREKWPLVRLVQNVENRGFAAACNQGAGLAAGEFLVFLNQDTRPLAGWLEGLLAPFAGQPGVGLTTSKVLVMRQPELVHLCGMAVHFSGLSFGRGLMQPESLFTQPARVGSVSGASFAIRGGLWEQLGGFDEFLYMYSEEIDLSWRACLAGYTSLFTPESRVLHDHWSDRPGFFSLYYSKRNRYILLYKTWRWRTLLLMLPGLALADLLDLAHSLRMGRNGLKASLLAWGWVVGHFGDILKARRKVQSARQYPDWVLLESCVENVLFREFRRGWVLQKVGAVVNVLFRANARVVMRLCRRGDISGSG